MNYEIDNKNLKKVLFLIVQGCQTISENYTQFTIDWIENFEDNIFNTDEILKKQLHKLYYNLEVIIEFMNPSLEEYKFFQTLYNLFDIYDFKYT
jgi:hypothetical protein